jgi:hypothetical protein
MKINDKIIEINSTTKDFLGKTLPVTIATLAAVYYYGKSRGKTLVFVSVNESGDTTYIAKP